MKKDYLFKFITTEDGSPTLRLLTGGTGESESMHSLKGAFSETAFIYGQALETCLQDGFPARVLSMGLGLGYVEILSAALGLKFDRAVDGESFELVPELTQHFKAWVGGENLPQDFKEAYDQIAERACNETGQNIIDLRSALREAFASARWRLRGPLDINVEFERPFGCICFDAFSSKTSPDLWTEEFLNNFLAKAAAESAILSTYARTGNLNRALRTQGFRVEDRAGFGTKRESTFAIRTR